MTRRHHRANTVVRKTIPMGDAPRGPRDDAVEGGYVARLLNLSLFKCGPPAASMPQSPQDDSVESGHALGAPRLSPSNLSVKCRQPPGSTPQSPRDDGAESDCAAPLTKVPPLEPPRSPGCSDVTAASTWSDGSRQPRSVASDGSRSQRSVTFRDARRLPRSLNAPSPGRAEGRDGRSAMQDETNQRMMARYGVAPAPVRFVFDHEGLRQAASNGATPGEGSEARATDDMFTDDEVADITPLQIATYLTMEEREEIGTRVLCSELKGGRFLLEEDPCDACDMPRLIRREDGLVMRCPVCPVLKRRVLKKILDGRGPGARPRLV